MKQQAKIIKIKISIFFLLLAGVFTYTPVHAQVNVNVNIGSQVLWGPVGYDYVEYYYLPEIDVFYYVPTGQYIYWQGNQQMFVTYLPASYHVNLYNTYKVVVNEPKPYLQHNIYIVKYAQYKHGGPKQMVIRDSNEEKYYVVKGHPKHNNSNGNKNAQPNKNSGNNHNDTRNATRSNQTSEQKSQPQRTERPAQNQQKQQQSQQQQSQQHQSQQQQKQSQQPSNKNSGPKGKGH